MIGCVPTLIAVLIAWPVAAVIVGMAIGRMIRAADRRLDEGAGK